ncbi:MAG TPA: hypothetical protein PKK59_03130 [Anaerolineaceae bacterium]|nr:hypothetical protein [Anaerolineaceae bacterium]
MMLFLSKPFKIWPRGLSQLEEAYGMIFSWLANNYPLVKNQGDSLSDKPQRAVAGLERIIDIANLTFRRMA